MAVTLFLIGVFTFGLGEVALRIKVWAQYKSQVSAYYSFGWGVDDDETFAAVCEQTLVDAGWDVDIVALAVPGYSTALEAVLLESKIGSLKPERVVLKRSLSPEHRSSLASAPLFINTHLSTRGCWST